MFYVDEDGRIVHADRDEPLMVQSSDDLPGIEARFGQGIVQPGLICILAGYTHAWQMGVDGHFEQIF